ncbi:MAG: hypothetical protein ACLTVB_00905 [Sutterella sp.]|jgi:hypothetical protein|uniref:Uncharacterized protein n=1 Tax=Myoviridae sp. ctakU3 TaxID=2825135 RepID=A0A8S5P2D6_9CAUD|nr:MAG TPA: hypothetical protein [Myoviridae sp. ctakU3]
MNTKPVYVFDSEGFYKEESLAQENEKENGDWLMPQNATDIKPNFDALNWAKWNGKKWVQIKKPSSAAECVGVVVSHFSDTPHDTELKALMVSLTNGSETHRLVRGEGEDPSWSVEEISAEELESKLIEEELSAHDAKVAAAKEDYLTYSIMGDKEEAEKARSVYLALISGEGE